MPLPPLNALRAFEVTARNLSFTKAAQELNVTRAAVSQQVKLLEQHLGAQLFERQSSALQLTQVAQQYYPLLSSLFQSVTATTDHLFAHKPAELQLRVAHSFCSQWLIPRLPDFNRMHPEVRLKISTTSQTVPDNSAHADIEIINGYGIWPDAAHWPLVNEAWILVASPGFLHLNPITSLTDLINLPKLCTSGYQETWQQWLAFQGLPMSSVTVGISFDHSILAIEAAIHQLGLLLVRDMLVQDELCQGTLQRVGPWSMPSQSAHHLILHSPAKPHAQKFAEWLLSSFST